MMHPRKKSIIRITAAIVAAAFVFTQCGINTAFALRTPEPQEQANAAGTISAELGVSADAKGKELTVTNKPAKTTGFQQGKEEYRKNLLYVLVNSMSPSIDIADRQIIADLIIKTAENFENVSMELLAKFAEKNFSWWSVLGGLRYGNITRLLSNSEKDAVYKEQFHIKLADYILSKGGRAKILASKTITPGKEEFETVTDALILDVSDIDTITSLILQDTDIVALQKTVKVVNAPVYSSANESVKTKTITLYKIGNPREIECQIVYSQKTQSLQITIINVTRNSDGTTDRETISTVTANRKGDLNTIASEALATIKNTQTWTEWTSVSEEISVDATITTPAPINDIKDIVDYVLKDPEIRLLQERGFVTITHPRIEDVMARRPAAYSIDFINPSNPRENFGIILTLLPLEFGKPQMYSLATMTNNIVTPQEITQYLSMLKVATDKALAQMKADPTWQTWITNPSAVPEEPQEQLDTAAAGATGYAKLEAAAKGAATTEHVLTTEQLRLEAAKKTALIIAPEGQFRNDVVSTLTEMGFATVFTANSANEAQELYTGIADLTIDLTGQDKLALQQLLGITDINNIMSFASGIDQTEMKKQITDWLATQA